MRSLSGSRGAGKAGVGGTALKGSEERSKQVQHAPLGDQAQLAPGRAGVKNQAECQPDPKSHLIQEIELPLATWLSCSKLAKGEDM